MIAAELDYRHEADPERYPIDIATNAIANLNRRQFPADPCDPPIHRTTPPMPADRQRLLDLIVAAGDDGITIPELRDALGWTDNKTHDQINKLARAELIARAPDVGRRNRYWAT